MLQISQNLESFVPSNYKGNLKLVYNTQAANPNGIVQMRKAKRIWHFDILFWLNQVNTTGTVILNFTNPNNTLNVEFTLSTSGNNSNLNYNINNTPPTGVSGTQWIYIEDLVNCMIASPIADFYDIRAMVMNTSSSGIIELEEKEIGINGSNGLPTISAKHSNNTAITIPATAFSSMLGRNGFNNYNQNVHLRILVEESPNFWVEIYKKVNNIGNRISTYELEYTFGGLAYIMRDYLKMHPMHDFTRIITDHDLFKKFKIEYWLENRQARVKASSGSIYPSIQYALCANIYPKHNIKAAFKIYEKTNIVLNNYHKNTHYIQPNQPAYFSILNPYVQGFRLRYIMSDNTIHSFDLPDQSEEDSMMLWHIPAWLHLRENNADIKIIRIELWQEMANVQEDVKLAEYIVDYSYQANARWYVYLNSIGGLDSLAAYEMDNQSMSLDKSTFVSKFNEIVNFIHHKTKFVVNSNYIDSLHVDNYKDMLSSRFIYEVDQDTIHYNIYGTLPNDNTYKILCNLWAAYRVNYWPIIVESKDISITPADNNLSLVKFDYKYDEVDMSGFAPNKSTRVNINPSINSMYGDRTVRNNFFINTPERIKFSLRLRQNDTLRITASGVNHYLIINGVEVFLPQQTSNTKVYLIPLIRTRENDTVVIEFGGYLMDILELSISFNTSHNLPSVMAFSLIENTTMPIARALIGFFELFDETVKIVRSFSNSKKLIFLDASIAVDQFLLEVLRMRKQNLYEVNNFLIPANVLSPLGQAVLNEINSNNHPSNVSI